MHARHSHYGRVRESSTTLRKITKTHLQLFFCGCYFRTGTPAVGLACYCFARTLSLSLSLSLSLLSLFSLTFFFVQDLLASAPPWTLFVIVSKKAKVEPNCTHNNRTDHTGSGGGDDDVRESGVSKKKTPSLAPWICIISFFSGTNFAMTVRSVQADRRHLCPTESTSRRWPPGNSAPESQYRHTHTHTYSTMFAHPLEGVQNFYLFVIFSFSPKFPPETSSFLVALVGTARTHGLSRHGTRQRISHGVGSRRRAKRRMRHTDSVVHFILGNQPEKSTPTPARMSTFRLTTFHTGVGVLVCPGWGV